MPTTDPDSGRPLAPWLHVAVGVLVDDRQQVLIQERIPGTPLWWAVGVSRGKGKFR